MPRLVAVVFLLLVCSSGCSLGKPLLTLDEFFNYTEFASFLLSPIDGQSLLTRTRHHLWNESINEYHIHLHSLVDRSKKLVARNASGSPELLWHGEWIAYPIENPDDDGQYYVQLYSTRTEQPFSIPIGKKPIHAWTWSNEETSLYFATQTTWTRAREETDDDEWKDVVEYRKQDRGDTIYRLQFNVTNRFKINSVTNISLRVAELLCSPDGRYIVFSSEANSQRIERIDEYEIYAFDLQQTNAIRLTNNQAIERNLKWLNGSIFFTVTGEGSIEGDYQDSQGRLYALNIVTGGIQRWASSFSGSVKAFAFLEDGRDGVVILGQSRTEVQVYTQQTASSPLHNRSAWPGTYEMISTVSINNRSMLVFLHSSFGVPQEVYLAYGIDRLDQAQPATNENKLFIERNLPRGKTYQWLNADDGTEIEGILLYPPDRFEDKNLPLLVLIHGGPYNYPDLNLFHADWYECAVMMATDGWLVFQPNYRGSGGRLLHSNGRRLNRLCRLW